ncbi:MAG: metallophosphoesterase family protein [Planctomycetes bacterium]|nr:metallophosphoesterase family protein [Planctomycetota bacterium]
MPALHSLVLALWCTAAPHDPQTRILELTARLRAEPARTDLRLERADLLLQVDAAAAAADFSRVLAADSTANAARRGLALALCALDRELDALPHLRQLHDAGMADPAFRVVFGRALAVAGRHAEAAAQFAAALPALPVRQPEHWLDLATALRANGRAEDRAAARVVLDRALADVGPAVALVEAAALADVAAGERERAYWRFQPLLAASTRPQYWHERRAAIVGNWQPSGMPLAQSAGSAVVSAGAELPLPPVAATTVLVPRGSTWRYRDNGLDPGPTWTDVGFADSTWSSGPAQLGYGDGDERTVVGFGGNVAQRHIRTWFRHGFAVADPAAFASLSLRLLRDDGARVWLNGVLVATSNVPAGELTPDTAASGPVSGGEERAFVPLVIEREFLQAGANVLAVELRQSSPLDSDLGFDLELTASTAGSAVVRGPWLQSVSATSAILRWRTDVATPTAVWLGTAGGPLQTAWSDPTPTTEHIATLTGLSPATRYAYAIGEPDAVLAGADAMHALTTSPPVGTSAPLRAWVLGDSGSAGLGAWLVRDAYAQHAAARPADLMLMLGDNAYDIGTDLEYQAAVFDMYPTFLRDTVLWPTLGNHDAVSARSATQSGAYYDMFSLPRAGEAGGLPSGTEAYYSFDRGHVHFVCLDSQDSSRAATGPMLNWLRADLASTSARWLVAFCHHPAYSKGSHDTDNPLDSGGRSRDMREQALPILEAAGVDLVLTGHSHSYERSFLLDGHYDVSTTLTPAMLLDRGSGDPATDGAYAKPTAGLAPHEGAVHVVAGSSSLLGGGPLGHRAMYIGMHMLGSLVLDIDGDRLDGAFVTVFGTVADRFTLRKGERRTLLRDEPTVSVIAGGTQHLHLRAGSAQAGNGYLLAGAFGTTPGFSLQGVPIPLNRDAWLSVSLRAANGPFYPNSVGTLDAGGAADCAVVLPPLGDPGLVGVSLHHAYIVFDAGGVVRMASNPVALRFVP